MAPSRAAEDKPTADAHALALAAMSSASAATAIPPLRLRPVASLPGLRASAVSPSSSFTTDEEDAERRNATALTIVELLARAGDRQDAQQVHGQSRKRKPDALRSPPTPLLVAPRPVLPSLPKMKVSPAPTPTPSTEHAWFLASPNSFFGMMTAHSVADKVASTPLAPAPAPTTPAAPPATVNNSRKRQKDELTRLRAQVQELQRELEHVRGRLPHRQPLIRYTTVSNGSTVTASAPNSTGSPTATSGATGAGSVPVWERMAQHQKEEKSKAEMENLRLKGLIQEQVKISRGLEKLLKKRCKNMVRAARSESLWSCDVGSNSYLIVSPFQTENPFPDKKRRLCDFSETALFDSLLSSIDARVHELDAVFEKSGLAQDKRELQETQMILDERRGPVMEVKDAKILPFDVATCSSALWKCFELESVNSHDNASEFDQSPQSSPVKTLQLQLQPPANTVYVKGTLPLHQNRAPDAELEIRGVMKRFVDRDDGRVVFLWESIVECPSKLLNYAAKDAEVRDYGWGVLEPVPGSVPGDNSTIVQLCSYIAPRVAGGSLSEECRPHVHTLADLVVPSYRNVWGKRQRVLENLLMDSAVSGRGSATVSTDSVMQKPVRTETSPM
jgi:hypothetical protein